MRARDIFAAIAMTNFSALASQRSHFFDDLRKRLWQGSRRKVIFPVEGGKQMTRYRSLVVRRSFSDHVMVRLSESRNCRGWPGCEVEECRDVCEITCKCAEKLEMPISAKAGKRMCGQVIVRRLSSAI